MYVSTKNYGPSEGLAVCYRQWRADRKSGAPHGSPYSIDEIPGCCALHGYALSIYIEFESETLDARNWVADFGSLRTLKEFLKQSFDHTMLVAQDDPHHAVFANLHKLGLAKMVEVEATGCESLSKFLHDYINKIWLQENYPATVDQTIRCRMVRVTETPSNSAWYES
jgi:6-pyruvoyltetrahydropterin/6-carboxytetrahydropterin synthase